MATNTYVALSTQTLASAVSSVTFSPIPQGYTDLVLVIGNLGMNSAGSAAKLRFNGDTATNYSNTFLYGTGSAAGSSRESNNNNIRIYGFYSGPTGSGNNDNVICHIQNYSNSTTNKTVLVRGNLPQVELAAVAGLWRSTSAITSLTVASYNGTDLLNAGSTFTIYGIAAASVGAKATGGTVYSDSQYIYHAFPSSGTFTPTQALTADALLVAGGGGAGINSGGGAGGVLLASSQSLASGTGYTVTVGGPGTAGSGNPIAGATNGTNSTFNSNSAIGGGAGGIESGTRAGASGGSGGGEGAAGTGGGGAGTSGQGNAGGTTGGFGGNFPGGGGGGAGAVGGNATSGTVAGNGGVGTTTYDSWSQATGFGEYVSGTYYFAGGGGASLFTAAGGTAGTRGLGGGGVGKLDGTTSPGLANTGGGGGASNSRSTGGAGGSGIVIIRYAR